jgi:hypothetical protein
MRRFLMQLAVVLVALSVTGAVHAGGGSKGSSGGKGSFSQSQSNFKTTTSKSSMPYGKCWTKSNFYCTHHCWCDYYGCNLYWCPSDYCWCVWYEPWLRYVPYRTYITLVSPVAVASGPAITVANTSVAAPGPNGAAVTAPGPNGPPPPPDAGK